MECDDLKEITDIPDTSNAKKFDDVASFELSNEKQMNLVEGTLVGLAVGDALGTTLEFCKPESVKPIQDIVGGGPFDLEPGQWTDDTSMALCLAESLVICNGFEPVDQLERYLKWYKEGYFSSTDTCFDIGNATKGALEKFEKTRNAFCGSDSLEKSGNGSIMRLAPVPMFFSNHMYDAIQMSGESSKTTHASILCIDACKLLGSIISGCLNGFDKKQVLSEKYLKNYWKKHPLCSEIEEILLGSYKKKNPPEIEGSGYVVKSLEAALWAFHNSNNFEDGCLMAVNLGWDADTTGAVYGQIAGSYYGLDSIPKKWIEKIWDLKLIKSFANKLHL